MASALAPRAELYRNPHPCGEYFFTGIRIHAGNTSKDTKGCILVGENTSKGVLSDSRLWVERLKRRIVDAKERGEGVFILIKN